jgi:hypothetical protein
MQGHTSRFDGDPVAVMTREDLRQDANWFADEVSIDFPSIAPVVERIRRSFLGDERPQALSVDVELTDREAASGVMLPISVPVHCTCTGCGGRGETWAERCPRCRGCGSELLRHPVHVTVPAGVRHGARFRFTVTPRHNRSTRIELRVVIAADR